MLVKVINVLWLLCCLDPEEDVDADFDFLLPFEIPVNFYPDRYKLGTVPDEVFESVPQAIGDVIFQVLGPDVPLHPQIVFLYLKSGALPHYVINYFMKIQKKKGLANMTRFYRALKLVHKYREFSALPPLHYLALDTASVEAVGKKAEAAAGQEDEANPGAWEGHEAEPGAGEEEEAGGEKEWCVFKRMLRNLTSISCMFHLFVYFWNWWIYEGTFDFY